MRNPFTPSPSPLLAAAPTTGRRDFLRRSGASALAAPALLAAAGAATPASPVARPVPALRPGGTVGVIAPASPVHGQAEQAAAWLKARGYTPRLFPSARLQSRDYLAGPDALRLADLHAAFADPGIDAILCLRGGYGSARLLDGVDFGLLGRHPKPFVGYSDITALLLAISRHAGFIVFHGPMLASDLLRHKHAATEAALFELLAGRRRAGAELPHPSAFPLETLVAGVAHGRLVGGNLALIGATLGTRYEIELDDAILFIEDVGETPQKIDRLLTQLRLAGKLSRLRGVLLGDFSDIDDPRATDDQSEQNLLRLREVWRDLLEPLAVPVLAGWRSGHCEPNLTLPIGAWVRLDAGAQGLWLEQDVIRTV